MLKHLIWMLLVLLPPDRQQISFKPFHPLIRVTDASERVVLPVSRESREIDPIRIIEICIHKRRDNGCYNWVLVVDDRLHKIELLVTKPSRYLLEAYQRLAQLLEEEGRPEAALEVLKQAVHIQTEIGRSLT